MSMGDKAGTGLSEEELLKKTEQRMAELSSGKPLTEDDDVDDDDTLEDDIDTDDDTGDGDDDQASDDDDDDDSTSDDDDDDSDADDTDDDDDDTDDGADGDDDKEIEISDAYYRAATNSGMTKDEIVDFMATNPELAMKTFANLHDNMNRVSSEFAEFGRAKKKKAAEEAANNGGGDDNNADKKSTYKQIDTTKLRDENPDSEGLVDVIEQIQEQNKSMHDQMSELAKAPVAHRNAEQEKLVRDQELLIGTQIDTFFNDPSLDAFATTYGKVTKGAATWDELLPSEKVNRCAVIDQVEQLMEGAKALGRDMDVTEALGRAHLMITQPIQAKMIREDIMKSVRKRSKGITLRPSSSKTSGKKTKKAKTEGDVVANAQQRMDKLFKRDK